MISKLIVACVCIVLGLVSSLLLNSCNNDVATINEIRSITDKYHAALVSKDEEVLDSILAERLRIITTFEDVPLSKNDYLERVRSLEGKLESVEVSDVRVEVDKSKATLECAAKMLLISKWSNVISHEAIYTYGFENIDGKWQISSIQQR